MFTEVRNVRFQEFLKKAWHRAREPFRRIERKVKLAAERFVVKSIAKHGTATDGAAVGRPAALGGAMGDVHLMLALMKSSQRPMLPARPTLDAIALGEGRLLVTHPTSKFMYADASNIKLVPQLALQSYQEQATIAIERELNEGDCVIQLGAGQGYHSLTIADTIGGRGRLVAVESQPAELRMLRMNIEAHSLEARVQVHSIADTQALPLDTWFGEGHPIAAIYISPDAHISDRWIRSLADCFARTPDTRLIVADHRLTFAEYVAAFPEVERLVEKKAA